MQNIAMHTIMQRNGYYNMHYVMHKLVDIPKGKKIKIVGFIPIASEYFIFNSPTVNKTKTKTKNTKTQKKSKKIFSSGNSQQFSSKVSRRGDNRERADFI